MRFPNQFIMMLCLKNESRTEMVSMKRLANLSEALSPLKDGYYLPLRLFRTPLFPSHVCGAGEKLP